MFLIYTLYKNDIFQRGTKKETKNILFGYKNMLFSNLSNIFY